MKRLLIGILALALLFPFCSKTVEVAYAQETIHAETGHAQQSQAHDAAAHHGPRRDTNDHACCAVHGGSNSVEHQYLQKQLPKSGNDLDIHFLLNASNVSVENAWTLDSPGLCVLDPPLFFRTNDFERRSEVMRR